MYLERQEVRSSFPDIRTDFRLDTRWHGKLKETTNAEARRALLTLRSSCKYPNLTIPGLFFEHYTAWVGAGMYNEGHHQGMERRRRLALGHW